MKNKLLFCLFPLLLLNSCGNATKSNADGAQQEEKEKVELTYTFYADYCGEANFSITKKVEFDAGDDISSHILLRYTNADLNGHAILPIGFYYDEEETRKMNTSDLYNYDGKTFNEIFIKCAFLDEIDTDDFLDGRYSNNLNDYFVIENGEIVDSSINNKISITSNKLTSSGLSFCAFEDEISIKENDEDVIFEAKHKYLEFVPFNFAPLIKTGNFVRDYNYLTLDLSGLFSCLFANTTLEEDGNYANPLSYYFVCESKCTTNYSK